MSILWIKDKGHEMTRECRFGSLVSSGQTKNTEKVESALKTDSNCGLEMVWDFGSAMGPGYIGVHRSFLS